MYSRKKFWWFGSLLQHTILIGVLGALFSTTQLPGQQLNQEAPPINNVVIELFYRGDSEQSLNATKYLQQLKQRRPGIEVKAYDVLKDKDQLKRLWKLSKDAGLQEAGLPTFYLCQRLKIGFRDAQTSGAQIEDLLTIKAYIRPGCKHCKAGKAFLDKMIVRWPAIQVQYYDVINNVDARTEVQNLAAQYRVQVASFPCIQVAGRLVVGYQTDEITGAKIEEIFQDRSVTFAKPDKAPETKPAEDKAGESTPQPKQGDGTTFHPTEPISLPAVGVGLSQELAIASGTGLYQFSYMHSAQPRDSPPQDQEPGKQPDEVPVPDDAPLPDEFEIPDDVALPDDVLIPGDVGDATIIVGSGTSDGSSDEIEVPVLGKLSVSKIGLPAFTFLIGLVDGFNPCAMWVLIFLLSVLVNLKERKKILLVAGTFVVVSGLAYFVFMAAWFNVFQLIGLLRPVQIGLGVIAIIVGLVNVKDFFAFHKGISFSIPESAKPGIYRRVRTIVSANHMTTALTAAIVLAVVVNIVELLCTAGLPALYTEVLTMQNLPTWANYSYLGLYISAYMLDDAILVGIVVTTLSHRRLQESEGRWLKLLSGAVILLLGAVMIFKPSLLL